MIRQRSEGNAGGQFAHVGSAAFRGGAQQKRLRYEVPGVGTSMRSPSPVPTMATVSRGHRVRAEVLSILEAFCAADAEGRYGGGLHSGGDGAYAACMTGAGGGAAPQQMPPLFDYVCPSSQTSCGGAETPRPAGVGVASSSSTGRPSALQILLEICSACDQVWRHGTCAEGPNYTNSRRSYPFDDSSYMPGDLLLPVPVPARYAKGDSPALGSAPSPFRAVPPSPSPSQEEAAMSPWQDAPPLPPSPPRLTMQPLTMHILLTLGGFERTGCGSFVHLRPPVRPSAEVAVPPEVVEAEYFVRPQTVGSAMDPVQATSVAAMASLYAAAHQLLAERGWPQPVRGTPLSIFLGHADGFGWRSDTNTIGACERHMAGRAAEVLRAQQDCCFVLWDAMLTDGGLPQIERGLHRCAGLDNMFHAFTSHYSYGAGLSAICMQSVPAAPRRPCEDEMDYCGGSYCAPPPLAAPLASLPMVSPPHVLCRARLAHGCAIVVMPAGLDGPVLLCFFVATAVRPDGPSDVVEANHNGTNLGYNGFSAQHQQQQQGAGTSLHPYESLPERSLRYLWWYVHQTALADFPAGRIRVVVSVGEVLTQAQVSMLPSQRRDVPRLSVVEALCTEGYSFVDGGRGDGAAAGGKKCRYVCASAVPTHVPPVRFFDLG